MPVGLAVALAGGAGAFTRYLLDEYASANLAEHQQVLATFAINIIGSLLLGLLIGAQLDGRTRIVLGVGFLAAFTTFSTLVAQVYHAMDGGRYATGLLLPVGSLAVGVFTLWAGVLAGRQFVA